MNANFSLFWLCLMRFYSGNCGMSFSLFFSPLCSLSCHYALTLSTLSPFHVIRCFRWLWISCQLKRWLHIKLLQLSTTIKSTQFNSLKVFCYTVEHRSEWHARWLGLMLTFSEWQKPIKTVCLSYLSAIVSMCIEHVRVSVQGSFFSI